MHKVSSSHNHKIPTPTLHVLIRHERADVRRLEGQNTQSKRESKGEIGLCRVLKISLQIKIRS